MMKTIKLFTDNNIDNNNNNNSNINDNNNNNINRRNNNYDNILKGFAPTILFSNSGASTFVTKRFARILC